MADQILASKLAFDGCLVATATIVLWRGGRDEKAALAIVVAAAALTAIHYPVSTWLGFRSRYSLLAIDAATLLAFDQLMVRSQRRWPIWATGVQLAAVSLDATRVLMGGSHNQLLIQGKFAYLIFLTMVIGSLRSSRS